VSVLVRCMEGFVPEFGAGSALYVVGVLKRANAPPFWLRIPNRAAPVWLDR